MALLTSRKTQPRYDGIVVGSGAASGQTAYTLAMEGAKVLLFEAGRNYDRNNPRIMGFSVGNEYDEIFTLDEICEVIKIHPESAAAKPIRKHPQLTNRPLMEKWKKQGSSTPKRTTSSSIGR